MVLKNLNKKFKRLKDLKTGFGTLLIASIFLFLAMITLVIVFASQKTQDLYVGEQAMAVIKASAIGESFKTFLKTSAKISYWLGLRQLLNNAGFESASQCGSFGYELWNNASTLNCKPDFKTSFFKLFENEFISRSSFNSYGFQIPGFAEAFSNDFKNLVVLFQKPLEIPITARGVSVKKQLKPEYANAVLSLAKTNFKARTNRLIKSIVVSTSDETLPDLILKMNDASSHYSVHYIVDTNGNVLQSVFESFIAFHAGCGVNTLKPGFENINEESIGVLVLIDKNNVLQPVSKQELQALAELINYLMSKYSLTTSELLKQSDVSSCQDVSNVFWNDLLNALQSFQTQNQQQTQSQQQSQQSQNQQQAQSQSLNNVNVQVFNKQWFECSNDWNSWNTQYGRKWRMTNRGIEFLRARYEPSQGVAFLSDTSCVEKLEKANLLNTVLTVAQAEGVAPQLLIAIICTETEGNFDAVLRDENLPRSYYTSCVNLLVSKGATNSQAATYCDKSVSWKNLHCSHAYSCDFGIAQFLYTTAISVLDRVVPPEDLLNPELSIQVLAKSVKDIDKRYKLHSDPVLHAHFHNSGGRQYINKNNKNGAGCLRTAAMQINNDPACFMRGFGLYQCNDWCLIAVNQKQSDDEDYITRAVKHFNGAVEYLKMPPCTGFAPQSSVLGTYYYDPSFSISTGFDFNVLNPVVSWAESVVESFSEFEGCSQTNEEFLKQEVLKFNKDSHFLLGSLSLGICDEGIDFILKTLKERFDYCSSSDEECFCNVTIPSNKNITSQTDYKVRISVTNPDNGNPASILTFTDVNRLGLLGSQQVASDLLMTPEYMPSTLLFEKKNDKLVITASKKVFVNNKPSIIKDNFDAMFVYKTTNQNKLALLVFYKSKNNKYYFFNKSQIQELNPKFLRLCALKKEKFDFCIPVKKELPLKTCKGIEWKPLTLKFALQVKDYTPPENAQALILNYDQNTQLLQVSWNQDLEDVYGFNVYYSVEPLLFNAQCPAKPNVQGFKETFYLSQAQTAQQLSNKDVGVLYLSTPNFHEAELNVFINIMPLLNDCFSKPACAAMLNNGQLPVYVAVTSFDVNNNENVYKPVMQSLTINIPTPNPLVLP